MTTIKLNEQIAFLRKQNKMTQEALANALGVSNQAVSKWESAQCCPDIQLLPDIAQLFGVSVDELMGYRQSRSLSDLSLQVKGAIAKGREAGFAAALRFAYAAHAAVVFKLMEEAKKERKEQGDLSLPKEDDARAWGVSCVSDPRFASMRRGGTVLFSDNALQAADGKELGRVCSVLQTFSDFTCLNVLFALHRLTIGKEDAFASAAEIASEANIEEESVKNCLCGSLGAFVREKSGERGNEYRIEEKYLLLAPLFSLLCGLEEICGN